MTAKRTLRRALLTARRATSSEERDAASRAAVLALRALPELAELPEHAPQRHVLAYVADPDELDMTALIAAPPSGWVTLLPRVDADALVAVAHARDAPLVVGAYGIPEPVGDALDPSAIDVVLVPGVAFTRDGWRLGRGAGLYDRLLASLRADAVRIGVCAEALVVSELPLEPHDQPVHVLVTDASTRRRVRAEDAGPAAPRA